MRHTARRPCAADKGALTSGYLRGRPSRRPAAFPLMETEAWAERSPCQNSTSASELTLKTSPVRRGHAWEPCKLGILRFSAAYVTSLVAQASSRTSCLNRQPARQVAGFITVAITTLALISSGVAAFHGLASADLSALAAGAALLCLTCGVLARAGAPSAFRMPQPLSRLHILAASAIIAPVLLFALYAGNRAANAQLDQIRANLISEARTLSAVVDREISGEIKRLQALAVSPSLRQGDFSAFQNQAEAALAFGDGGGIIVVDPSLQQIVNTSMPFGTPLEKATTPEVVKTTLATGKPQVTGLFMGVVTGQPLFAVTVPVQIDGENRYALIRSINPHVLAGLVAAHDLPIGWQVAVSDAMHRIVVRSAQEGASIESPLPQAQWSRTGSDGVFEFTDNEGRPSLEAYARSDLTGWETAVWGSKALLEAPVRALWRTFGWLALVALSLAVVPALWLARLITRAVDYVTHAALGEGRPLPAGGTGVAEINTLIAKLGEAAAERQAFEAALRRSEATFRSMFDVSSVGKVEVEFETGRFLRVNDAMCKLVGYSREELLDRTVWDITHPDERDQVREMIHEPNNGESPVFDMEKRYIRKDGKEVWARVTANVILGESGRPVRCTVIQDLTDRVRAEQALRASKDRLQLAFDATRLGWWQYDPLRGVISGDERAMEIFDAPKEGMTVEENESKRVHPDDVQRVHAAFWAGIDPADPKPLSIEYRIRRRDGTVRWVENHGLAYFEGAGPERRVVAYAGAIQDVTERKEREEKEHLLMREINHRAKNMLSVVASIAHQTAARSPKDFVGRFSERIQALSANQDLLVRSEWKGVDIEDLVRAQLAHFADLIGPRIVLLDPRLRLNPASAQTIGLALHELATNAGKYGALSTDRGRVEVSWGIDGDDFTMSWTERDGPLVSPPTQHGFGTIVMDAMTAQSVGGTVQLDYAPLGVSWRLTCPKTNVIEWGKGQ
jgi:PAS domain S-box-containing protein